MRLRKMQTLLEYEVASQMAVIVSQVQIIQMERIRLNQITLVRK